MPKQPRKLGGMEEFIIPCVIEMHGTAVVLARSREEAERKFLFKHFTVEDDLEMVKWRQRDKPVKSRKKVPCPDCGSPTKVFSYIATGRQCENCVWTDQDGKKSS